MENVARLEQIDIEGYRSCRMTSFKPNSELSALIGVNGAGKTNILQAIRLLGTRRQRPRRKLSESDSKTIDTTVTAWFNVNDIRVGLRVRYSALDEPRSGDELIAIEETWNFHSINGSRAWRPLPPIEILVSDGRGVEIDGHIYFFETKIDAAKYRGKDTNAQASWLFDERVATAATAVEKFRAGISYYSASQFTNPSRCPSNFEVNEDGRLSEPYLTQGSQGSTHLKFLHDLYRLKNSNENIYEEYCKFVSKQRLGLISRITWKEIELSSNTAEVKKGGTIKKIRKTKTLVIPKVQIGPAYITFNQLSEGTFKTLALIFYIMTDESKFLMVEEPEVCVHHGLLARVVGTIKSYSSEKQTIISTHSDLLLDDLEPDNIFVVELNNGGTSVKPLENWLGKNGRDALHTYLSENGSLGEYWRSGGLS